VPGGTVETQKNWYQIKRPYGTRGASRRAPSVETLGYYRSSLRDSGPRGFCATSSTHVVIRQPEHLKPPLNLPPFLHPTKKHLFSRNFSHFAAH